MSYLRPGHPQLSQMKWLLSKAGRALFSEGLQGPGLDPLPPGWDPCRWVQNAVCAEVLGLPQCRGRGGTAQAQTPPKSLVERGRAPLVTGKEGATEGQS